MASGNGISGLLNFKIFWGSMPPDPPKYWRLRRASGLPHRTQISSYGYAMWSQLITVPPMDLEQPLHDSYDVVTSRNSRFFWDLRRCRIKSSKTSATTTNTMPTRSAITTVELTDPPLVALSGALPLSVLSTEFCVGIALKGTCSEDWVRTASEGTRAEDWVGVAGENTGTQTWMKIYTPTRFVSVCGRTRLLCQSRAIVKHNAQ